MRVVLDVETASYGDHNFDFRYLPAQEATVDLFLATARHDQRGSGRRVDIERVVGWHIRTVLGDALWRTEANVALPGRGTLEQWIDELDRRLRELAPQPYECP